MTRELTRNGAAHRALQMLRDMGGKASAAELRISMLSHFRSHARFENMVKMPLASRKLIVVDGERIAITSAGELWLGSMPRLSHPEVDTFKPLGARPRIPMREGSLDYQKYPSMAGGKRVPFRSSIANADDEGSNG